MVEAFGCLSDGIAPPKVRLTRWQMPMKLSTKQVEPHNQHAAPSCQPFSLPRWTFSPCANPSLSSCQSFSLLVSTLLSSCWPFSLLVLALLSPRVGPSFSSCWPFFLPLDNVCPNVNPEPQLKFPLVLPSIPSNFLSFLKDVNHMPPVQSGLQKPQQAETTSKCPPP